jgi:hypothetical protein
MRVRFEVLHPQLGSWNVTLPADQWGYTSGTEYPVRAEASSPYGRLFRIATGEHRRAMVVTFREQSRCLDPLRSLTVFAHRFCRDVNFYPDVDTDPDAFWVVNWPLSLEWRRLGDGLQELELTLVEQIGA